MKELLDNLLISEVAAVAGASQDSVANWVRYDLISKPPIPGKHRRFAAVHTIEVVLMQKLVELGITASVAGQIAVRAAPAVLQSYVMDWAERQGDTVVMTRPWTLAVNLDPPPSFIAPRILVDVGQTSAFENFREGTWLKIPLDQVMEQALTRALALRHA